jgi:hypothetical protein
MGNNNTNNIKPVLKKYLKTKNEKNLESLIKLAVKDKKKSLNVNEIQELVNKLSQENDFNEENYPGVNEFIKEMKYVAVKSKGGEFPYEKVFETVFFKKIVLLGSGDVGKTTFFRQTEFFFDLFDEDELKDVKNIIFNEIITIFIKLYENIRENKIKLENIENKVKN